MGQYNPEIDWYNVFTQGNSYGDYTTPMATAIGFHAPSLVYD
jgi:hypothetical protein